MAPRGAALHRRRRRGELGHLTLPHRRHRRVRGDSGSGLRLRRRDRLARCRVSRAVAGGARGRPPDRCATSRAIGRAVAAAARLALRNRAYRICRATTYRCPPEPTNSSLLPMAMIFRRCRRVGRPRTLTRGDQQHAARGIGGPPRPASGTWWPQTARSPSTMPVNERVADDTRANAVASVDITVDPAPATTDLREIRAATKQALIRHPEVPDERWPLLPLVPLVPKRLARNLLGVGTARCQRRRLIQPRCGQPGRQPGRRHRRRLLRAVRSRYPGVTRAMMHRVGGLLALLSGRAHGRVFVSVLAYQPGRRNPNDELRHDLSSALTDFSLTATTDWGCPDASGGAR